MTNEELWAAGKLPELWEAVKRLLYQFARSFYLHQGKEACARHGVTVEDLQQENYFAFLNAVTAYKPEKGFRFTSYLSRHAENRFRACMGIFTKLDALNYADSMNAPAAEDNETESGDLIPDEKAEAVLTAVDDEAEKLHITPQDVRRELEKGLRELRGKKQVWKIKEDYQEMAAYHGTGWGAWYYEQGSVEERTAEGMEKKGLL